MAKKIELPPDHIVSDDPKSKYLLFVDDVRYERSFQLPDGRWAYKKSA